MCRRDSPTGGVRETRDHAIARGVFRSVLVPLDLGRATQRSVRRAGLLPLSPRGRLILLHVVPAGLTEGTRRVAEQDAARALQLAANSLPPLARSRAVLVVTSGEAAERAVSEARRLEAELIVMGRSGGHELRDAFLGSTAERVVRRARLPVLVVADRPAKPYAKPLVALGVDSVAKHALRALLRLLPPERPALSVVHAYSRLLPKMTYPSLPLEVVMEYGSTQRAEAERELSKLLARTRPPKGSEPVVWKPYVLQGSPRNVIQDTARRVRADLLVVGTRGHSRAAQLLLGSVSGDALRDSACDVLVVPPPSES